MVNLVWDFLSESEILLAITILVFGALSCLILHKAVVCCELIDACRKSGVTALRELEAALIEAHLRGDAFLAGHRPTLADIACFPHAMLAPDGGISTDPYPAIRLWTRSLRALPRFIEMPGIHRLHELKPEPTGSSL